MAIALVTGAHTNASAANEGLGTPFSVTTTGIDTTGANLIILVVSARRPFQTISDFSVSDNKSNSYSLADGPQFGNAYEVMYYCASPTVGSGHTFTFTDDLGFSTSAICVAAFSGASATPLDQHTGAGSGFENSQATGSITPSQDGCLVVSGAAINNLNIAVTVSFGSILEHNNWGTQPGVNIVDTYLAYEIQTTATARNETWTFSNSGGGYCGASIASFKAAAAGAACVPTRTLIGVGCGIQAVRAMIRNRVVRRRGVLSELLGVGDE